MLNNELVPWKSEIKYLGVIPQESLNWNPFVAHTIQNAATRLNTSLFTLHVSSPAVKNPISYVAQGKI